MSDYDDTNSNSMSDDEWSSDDALKDLTMERTVHGEETSEETAQRLIRENLPLVTSRMIHTALHDPNGATRSRAGMYLMDRALGKPSDGTVVGTPLEDLLRGFATEVEDFANTASSASPDSNEKGE